MSDQSSGKLSQLRVLLLEDLPADAFLIERQVKSVVQDLEMEVTKRGTEFEENVLTFKPHLILSDYSIPRYSGMEALQYVNRLEITVPFVFVTSTLQDEELAAATILNGANGFVLKNNLEKLGPLILSLMTAPQVNTPFEIQSTLWIYQYQAEMIRNDASNDYETSELMNNNVHEMYVEAQNMLKEMRKQLKVVRERNP